jgi:hypothetical protein
MRPTTIILPCVLALAGCATTLDADSCRNADWYKIGHRDGVAARASQLEAHAAACAPSGSKPDAANYAKGLEEGRAANAAVTAQRRMSLF